MLPKDFGNVYTIQKEKKTLNLHFLFHILIFKERLRKEGNLRFKNCILTIIVVIIFVIDCTIKMIIIILNIPRQLLLLN